MRHQHRVSWHPKPWLLAGLIETVFFYKLDKIMGHLKTVHLPESYQHYQKEQERLKRQKELEAEDNLPTNDDDGKDENSSEL